MPRLEISLAWLVLFGCYASDEGSSSTPRDGGPDARSSDADARDVTDSPDLVDVGVEEELPIERCAPSDVVEPEIPRGALRSATVDASAWRPLPNRAECCDLVTRAVIGDPEGEVAISRLAARGDGTFYVAWEIGSYEERTREVVVARIDEEGRVLAGPRSLGRWLVTGLAAHGSRAVLTANRPTSRGGVFEGHVFALDEHLAVCEPFEREDNVRYYDVARHVAGRTWVVVTGRRRSRTTDDLTLRVLDDSLRVVGERPLRDDAQTGRITLHTSGAYLVTDVFESDFRGNIWRDVYVDVDAELRRVGERRVDATYLGAFRDELVAMHHEEGWLALELPTLATRPLGPPAPSSAEIWRSSTTLVADHVLGTLFSGQVVFAGDGRWLATSPRTPTAAGNDAPLAPGVMFIFGAGTNLGGLPRGVRIDVARLRNVE